MVYRIFDSATAHPDQFYTCIFKTDCNLKAALLSSTEMTAEEERSLPNGHGPLPNGNIDKNSTADDHSPDGATEHSAGGSTEETTPPAKEGTEATPEATPEATREAIPEGQEVVLIQDTGFTIQISCPGMEPFDLPVSQLASVTYKVEANLWIS